MKSLYRRLPPPPPVSEPLPSALAKVDDILAGGGDAELTLESLAVLIDQIWPKIDPPASWTRTGEPGDVELARYMSDCQTQALAHAKWANGQAKRPAPPPPSSSPPRGDDGESESPGSARIVIVTASVNDEGHRLVIDRLDAAMAALELRATLVVTGERAPREPALQVWRPTASDRADDERAIAAATWRSIDEVIEIPARGDLLSGARFALRRLRDSSGECAVARAGVFIEPLTSPMTSAIAFGGAAPVQVSISLSQPSYLRRFDSIVYAGLAPCYEARLIGEIRGCDVLDWTDHFKPGDARSSAAALAAAIRSLLDSAGAPNRDPLGEHGRVATTN